MRRAWVVAAGLLAALGCGHSDRGAREQDLSFTMLSDTAGLAQGAPLLTAFEPTRLPNGLIRVRGAADLPDGTRLQVSIYRRPDHALMARLQVLVQERRFESPPTLGGDRPLPPGGYEFELLAHFNEASQTPAVMAASGRGSHLRGPGVTRDRIGQTVFRITREGTL